MRGLKKCSKPWQRCKKLLISKAHFAMNDLPSTAQQSLQLQVKSALYIFFALGHPGLKISMFQFLVGALRSQTRDGLVTPQCISGWILLPKTELFQSDPCDVKPSCRFRVRWSIERVMEAGSCFLRNKGSCPLQPKEGRDADKCRRSCRLSCP